MSSLQQIFSGILNGSLCNTELAKKIFWLTLCSALIAIPIAIIPYVPTLAPAIHSKDLALRLYLSVLSLIALINIKKIFTLPLDLADCSLLGFFAFQLVSVIFSEFSLYSFSSSWQLIMLPVLALIVKRFAPSINDTKTLFYALIFSGLICSLYGFFSYLGMDILGSFYPFQFESNEGGGRNFIHSFFGNPEYFAGFVAPITVVSLGMVIVPNVLSKLEKTGMAITVLFLLLVFALSGSRAAVIGFIIGIFIIFLTQILRQSRSVKRKFFLSALGMLIIAVAGIVVLSTSNPLNQREMRLYQRFKEIGDLRSVSVRERIFFYTLTAYGIPKNSLFGTGPGTFQLYYFPYAKDFIKSDNRAGASQMMSALNNKLAVHPHNDYLEYIFELGFVGFGGLILIYSIGISSFIGREVSLLKREITSQCEKLDSLRIVCFGALVCILMNASTSFPLHMAARGFMTWVLIGLYLGINKQLVTTPLIPAKKKENLTQIPVVDLESK